jgi:5-methyltetrahydropteroyltriglutamate--homocysteine methyltransferase
MAKLFETYEIGSLAKHNWRLKGFSGAKLTEADIDEAETWGKRLGIDYKPLIKLLKGDAPDKRQQVVNWSALYAVRMFEKLGLDYVYTGEQWREEMYAHVAKNVEGFEFTGWIKSFDYRYYRKAAVVGEINYRDPFYIDEYEYIKPHAKAELKVPITGPYTMTDWSFNKYYWSKLGKVKSLKERKSRARRELMLDVVDNALRPEFEKLIAAGTKWIQIDEPALTTQPTAEEMSLFVEAWNRLVAGLDCRFSLHNCYSDYGLLTRYVPDLKKCEQLSLEFANRDTKAPERKRPAYDLIRSFEDHGYEGAYAPGFVHVHTNQIASPEVVRDRILCVADIAGAERVYVAPDCGLRTRTWEVAYQKLENLVKGADLAREAVS